MPDLANRFEGRMREAHVSAKELGYNPTAFAGMVADHGWLGAARSLLRPGPIQSGFERLWLLDRLDLTVEAVVLEDEWQTLFTAEELTEARRRLDELGWFSR